MNFSRTILAVGVGLLTVGCTNYLEDDFSVSQNETRNTIVFDNVTVDSKSLVTRGYATTASNALSTITSFQTWAYDNTTDGLYMGNSETSGRVVTNTGTALAPVWSYSPQQFWPVNALNFVAVTPAAAPTGGTLTHSTASASNVVTLTSNYIVPVDVENQVDLMYAEADGVTKSSNGGNVPYTFKHALSQIVFKGKLPTSGAITKVTIAEISLCNVNSAGIISFSSDGIFYGGGLYGTTSVPVKYTLDAGDLENSVFEVGQGGVVAGTSFNLTVSENNTKKNSWMLLPQHTAAWAGPAAINASPASGAYLKVRAQLEKDGVVILGNAEADAFYIPLTANWDRSKKYIYTLEFNGTNALTPITFSVAAQDWIEVDAYYAYNDITATANAAQDMSASLTNTGNFSGITAIDNSHFAIVDDKSSNEGWYPITMSFNTDGSIASLTQGSFVTAASDMTNQDNEAIAYNPARGTFFLTREMGNQIFEYNSDGSPSSKYISTSDYSGITSNAGFESLTYNPNFRKFYTTTEQSTSSDDAGIVTIRQYDGGSLNCDGRWKYTLEDALYSPASGDTYAKGVSDLCALEDGRLLVLEREAWVSPGTVSARTTTKIFVVNPAITANGGSLEKSLLTSWTTTDSMFSVMSKGYFDFANYEGMCLGPRLDNGARVLILLTDSQNRHSVGSFGLKDFWKTIQLQGI